MTKLEKLREQIDAIDDDVVNLLMRRAELVLEVKATKQRDNIDIYSPDRERQILKRVAKIAADGAFPLVSLEKIFVNIISATRSLIGDLHIAFPGPECSLAHDAAIKQFGDTVHYLPESGIDEVVTKVERGDAHFGVIPVRFSSSALHRKTFELLMQSNLCIIAEISLKERLVLYGAVDVLSEIKRVYADSYFFARSEAWLAANLPGVEHVVLPGAAAAAKRLEKEPDAAFIATESAAGRYRLKPLASGIESDSGSDARFFVIGHSIPSPTGNDKTSLLCSVEEKPGALIEVLQPFAERNITLLKIESHPMRNRAWEYVFFIDILGHQADEKVAAAIGELAAKCVYTKTLGSYPAVCAS